MYKIETVLNCHVPIFVPFWAFACRHSGATPHFGSSKRLHLPNRADLVTDELVQFLANCAQTSVDWHEESLLLSSIWPVKYERQIGFYVIFKWFFHSVKNVIHKFQSCMDLHGNFSVPGNKRGQAASPNTGLDRSFRLNTSTIWYYGHYSNYPNNRRKGWIRWILIFYNMHT